MTDSQQLIPDVSRWQGPVDWSKVKGYAAPGYAPVNAAIIRVAFGTSLDAYWEQNIREVRSLGFKAVGIYLAHNPSLTPEVEAEFFVHTVGRLLPGEFVIFDLELSDTGAYSDLAPIAERFFVHTEITYGVHDLLYSDLSFVRQHNLAGAGKPLWIAAYNQGEPSQAHTLWQFTDAQPFPGIEKPCDASVFHGSIEELLTAMGWPRPKPTPTAPPAPTRTLQVGSAGPQVRYLRGVFGIASGSIYTTWLAAWVHDYQRRRPWLWPANGRCTPRTYRSIVRHFSAKGAGK